MKSCFSIRVVVLTFSYWPWLWSKFQVNSFSSHHGKIDYGISSISRHHQFRDSHHLLLRESSFCRFCPAACPLSALLLCTREAACEDSPRTPVPFAFHQQRSPRRRARGASEVRLIILQAPCLQGCLALPVALDLRSWFFTLRLSPFRFLQSILPLFPSLRVGNNAAATTLNFNSIPNPVAQKFANSPFQISLCKPA